MNQYSNVSVMSNIFLVFGMSRVKGKMFTVRGITEEYDLMETNNNSNQECTKGTCTKVRVPKSSFVTVF